jgi:hypothetical protein
MVGAGTETNGRLGRDAAPQGGQRREIECLVDAG